MKTERAITRTLEPGITFFSAAEIRVVLLPVGEIPDDVFQNYASMVMAHRQVELSNVRSFYKESQKSPFKFFPWKTGSMHLRFLSEDSPAASSPLAPLHNHRRVLGVIGLVSCPHTPDLARRYKEFEQRCRAFPDAATVRCLGFDPAIDAPAGAEDAKARPNLILFPPGQGDHLLNHMEVVMHDFAACVLGAIETAVLNSSPAAVPLGCLVDTPEFTGMAVAPYAGEDEAGRTKRRYSRVQKAMGDYSLLAGSPLDAIDHYNTAAELGRASGDWTFAAAAMEGYAASKLLHAADTNDAFATSAVSVFRDEEAWRSPRRSSSSGHGISTASSGKLEDAATAGAAAVPPAGEGTPSTAAGRKSDGGDPSDGSASTPAARADDAAEQQNDSGGGGIGEEENVEEEEEEEFGEAFDGAQFWSALRGVAGLEAEVKELVDEAKAAIRRRGGLPLLVETDLKWARLLAGLHGQAARREASELASSVQLAAELLALPEDRLIALTEAAGVLGAVGARRKRVLLMWQAVELSKYFGFPDSRTLAVAREALEPAAQGLPAHPLGDAAGDEWATARRPLSQEVSIPRSWGAVRAGCLEAALGLAIYAKRHADVWDAAAALLRDHAKDLSVHRMQSLMDNLAAAASQMGAAEKARPGLGPPPLLTAVGPRALAPGAAPVWVIPNRPADGAPSPSSRQQNLFLYDPFAARRQSKKEGEAAASAVVEWVCGEPAVIDIEVSNPASVSVKIEKMVLEALFVPAGAPTGTPPRPATKAQWKGKPVSINIPARTKPVRIQLEGTPLAPGVLTLAGCKLMAFGGVSWSQSWTAKVPSLATQLAPQTAAAPAPPDSSTGSDSSAIVKSGGGSSSAQNLSVKVLPALPRLEMELRTKGNEEGEPTATTPRAGGSPAVDFGAPNGSMQPASNLRLLHGQTLPAVLRIMNTGAIAVHSAHVGLRTLAAGGGAEKRRGGGGAAPGKFGVDIDTTLLDAALPLSPGASVELPVRFSAPAGGFSGSAHEESAVKETLAVEYASAPEACPSYAAAVTNDPARGLPGRVAALEVAVTAAPSLVVAAVDFAEVHCTAADAAAAANGATEDGASGAASIFFPPRTVLMAEVVNRGRWALACRLDANPSIAAHPLPSVAEGSDGENPAHVAQLPLTFVGPGQRVRLSYLLPEDWHWQGMGLAKNPPQASAGSLADSGDAESHVPLPFIRAGHKYEERERQACAAWLARRTAVLFELAPSEVAAAAAAGVEHQGGPHAAPAAASAAAPTRPCCVPGVLPMVEGEVYNGLTSSVLSMLRPCAATLRLSVAPLGSSSCAPSSLLPVDLGVTAAAAADPTAEFVYAALPAALGQPLRITLEIESHVDEPLELFCSLACCTQAGGNTEQQPGGNAAQAAAEATISALYQSALLGGGPLGAGGGGGSSAATAAAWTGMHSGLHFAVEPRERVTHVAGLAVLAPGAYRVAAGHVSAVYCRKMESSGDAKSRNTLLGVQPCFVAIRE